MTSLNPTHLQTFAVVAEMGNLTQAGLRLNLGQSAVSSQLRQLQEAMGEPLYRRTGHGVSLTPAGQALLPHAQELARQVRLAEELMEARQQVRPPQVTLGVCLTLGETLPPLILQACNRLCPDVHLDVLVAPTEELGRAVQDGQLLLAFAGGTPTSAKDSASPLQVGHAATDRLVWVPPHGGVSGPVTLQEAAHSPWLWAHGRSTIKKVVETAARQQNIDLPESFVLGSYAAVRQGVLSGMGGAFLPRHHLLVSRPGETFTGQPLSDVDLRLPYQMMTRAVHQTDTMWRLRQATLGVLDEVLG